VQMKATLLVASCEAGMDGKSSQTRLSHSLMGTFGEAKPLCRRVHSPGALSASTAAILAV